MAWGSQLVAFEYRGWRGANGPQVPTDPGPTMKNLTAGGGRGGEPTQEQGPPESVKSQGGQEGPGPLPPRSHCPHGLRARIA